MKRNILSLALGLCLIAGTGGFTPAIAHGNEHDSEIGRATEPDMHGPFRVIEVDMGDVYFDPGAISVAAGETVLFVVINSGRIVHEFNIGTPETHVSHRDEMIAMFELGVLEVDHVHHDRMAEMGMMHDDPNSVLLAPGESAEILWTFPVEGELQFACNLPGHYEAGMVGDFRIASIDE